MHGFTCGVDDLLITKEKDSKRKKHLEACAKVGQKIHREALAHEDVADIGV